MHACVWRGRGAQYVELSDRLCEFRRMKHQLGVVAPRPDGLRVQLRLDGIGRILDPIEIGIGLRLVCGEEG